MSQLPSPDQQPPQGPSPEEQAFHDLLNQPPYIDYVDDLNRTAEEEAEGDPHEVVRIKEKLLREMVRQFPPLKEAYDKAFPEGKDEPQEQP